MLVFPDKALVKIESFLDTTFKSDNGVEFALSEAYNPNPNSHITCKGKLMNLCKSMLPVEENNTIEGLRKMLYRSEAGYPDYSRDTLRIMKGDHHLLYDEVYSDSISIDLQEGDDIYFFHSALDESNKVNDLYKIDYRHIICAIRGSEIIMNAANVLLEPLLETRVTASGFIYGINNPVPQVGIVKHIGSPLKFQTKEASIGDKVIYIKNFDYPLRIENKNYLVCPQYKIITIL